MSIVTDFQHLLLEIQKLDVDQQSFSFTDSDFEMWAVKQCV